MGRDEEKFLEMFRLHQNTKDILLEEVEAHYKRYRDMSGQSCAALPNLTFPALFFHLQNGKLVSFQFKFLSL